MYQERQVVMYQEVGLYYNVLGERQVAMYQEVGLY